jgi:hypothetical protein
MEHGLRRRELRPASITKMFTKAPSNRQAEYTFTISARGKSPNVPVFTFLRRQFGNVPLGQIESLFGFVERSTLYGGRGFIRRELSDRDVLQLNNAGIGLRIPMSNHHVTRAEYEQNTELLRKYCREGNSIIATNDDLARWVRQDFPEYRLDASVIKNINNRRKLDQALEIYDEIVLPMKSNEDFGFLNTIDEKDRITLFANAGCAFTCPSRTCYASVSRINKGNSSVEFQCSQSLKERELLGMIDFDLQQLNDLGFHRFKLLRGRQGQMTGF